MPGWTSELSPGGSYMQCRQIPLASSPNVTAGDSLAVGAQGVVTERGDGYLIPKGDGEFSLDGEFSAAGTLSFEVEDLDSAGNPTGTVLQTLQVGAVTADERFSATFRVSSGQAYKPIHSATTDVKRLLIVEINQ